MIAKHGADSAAVTEHVNKSGGQRRRDASIARFRPRRQWSRAQGSRNAATGGAGICARLPRRRKRGSNSEVVSVGTRGSRLRASVPHCQWRAPRHRSRRRGADQIDCDLQLARAQFPQQTLLLQQWCFDAQYLQEVADAFAISQQGRGRRPPGCIERCFCWMRCRSTPPRSADRRRPSMHRPAPGCTARPRCHSRHWCRRDWRATARLRRSAA